MRNLKAILIVLLCLCGIHVQAQQLEIKGLNSRLSELRLP